ncbi:MAG: kelch repeat-containing protein [Planctomycetota bacterium]
MTQRTNIGGDAHLPFLPQRQGTTMKYRSPLSTALVVIAISWFTAVGLDASAADRSPPAQGDTGSQPDPPVSRFHRPLPESLTSFGASVVDGYLYVFSGHSGSTHGFGKDLLVDRFRRIRFDDPDGQWEDLAMHQPAQSTALVTDGNDLYRVGGLSFLNESGDETNFNSTSHFAKYSIDEDQWHELSPLPESRSSLDAAVVGRKIYVVGGWDLQGKSSRDATWHDTVAVFDLDQADAGWSSIDGPGYKLRASSVAAHDGKLYVIGGMGPSGFLRRTSIYDPETQTWAEGPELRSDSRMTGFATSSFATGGRLYITGSSGIVYALAADGQSWEVANRLLYPRMFLRLLRAAEGRLLAVGGTGPSGMGRLSLIESLRVGDSVSTAPKAVAWTVPYTGKAKHSQALVLLGSKLYAMGGNASWSPHDFSEGAFLDQAFAFDINERDVQELPTMPMPVQSGAGVLHDQNSDHTVIMVLGGMNYGPDGHHALSSALKFDPETEAWEVCDSQLPEPRAMACAIAHDDALWMLGGSDAGHSNSPRESVLHWWGDSTAIGPLPKVEMPHPRRSFATAVIDDECFVIGGLGTGMSIESNVDVFHLNDRTWRSIPSPHASRVFPAACVNGGKIWLFGGFQSSGGVFEECSTLECYDPESNTWTIVDDSIPGVDASMRLFDFNGRLLFFGIDRQDSSSANFVLYDPDPVAEPLEVAAMTFGASSTSESAEQNAKSLMRKDTNKDGVLSLQELGNRLQDFAAEADADGDSRITMDELVAKMTADEQAEAEEQAKQQALDLQQQKVAAQEKADELQRQADAKQREADQAQRQADAAQREADALQRETLE